MFSQSFQGRKQFDLCSFVKILEIQCVGSSQGNCILKKEELECLNKSVACRWEAFEGTGALRFNPVKENVLHVPVRLTLPAFNEEER